MTFFEKIFWLFLGMTLLMGTANFVHGTETHRYLQSGDTFLAMKCERWAQLAEHIEQNGPTPVLVAASKTQKQEVLLYARAYVTDIMKWLGERNKNSGNVYDSAMAECGRYLKA